MKSTLAFMAAGFGTRFGGGIKQLEPIGPNGEVLMDYAAHDAVRAGFDRIVFIIRKDIEKDFRDGIGRRIEKKCDVEYAYQDLHDVPEGIIVPPDRKKPLGTGHAVLACRKLIHEPFCVLNADDYYGPQAFARIHDYITSPERNPDALECCMAGFVMGNTLSESGAVTRGVCRMDESGKLISIRETKGIRRNEDGVICSEEHGKIAVLDENAVSSMNIWGLPAKFMNYLEDGFKPFLKRLAMDDMDSEYLLPVIIGKMIQGGEGSVQVLPTGDKWFGMTYAADKVFTRQRIRELIDQGMYPERL